MLKKLYNSLLIKFTSLVFGALLLLYLISYALMNKFMLEQVRQESLTNAFNDVWVIIGLVSLGVFIGVFLILRFFIKSITDEIDDINSYLEEINKKNYEAVLKIEHHLEFLQLSLLLKNIVKRLKNKKK